VATGAALRFQDRLDLWRHSIIGEQEMAKREASRYAQLLVRWHHEWWNGSGYPDALRQDEIPLAARILRLADSYAALTDARPFRSALTESEAREQIVAGAAIEFDPAVVTAFLALPNIEELKSFAKTAEDLVTPAPKVDDNWTIFSSFTK